MISLSSPILVGIYENSEKIREFSSEKHASDAIVEILREIRSEFTIKSIIYANGPGSFMGLKVAYVVLKTFCIATNCDFYAVSGFELNGNGAIRANKALSFVKNGDEIKLLKCEPSKFKLPQNLVSLNKNSDTLPNYVIDAI